MSYITDYQYHENGGNAPTTLNLGSYQHIPINQIVSDYMLMFVGEDKVVDNVQVHEVRWHAKQAIKLLNYDAFKQVKAKEATIDSSLKMDMPSDYVDYVRISLCVDGVLYKMFENTKAMTAQAYLVDANNNLTFDANGDVLLTTSELDQTRLDGPDGSNTCSYDGCVFNRYSWGGVYGLDTAEANSNPTFRINRDAGVIDFDSNMRDEKVVVEYISDGMNGGDDDKIGVHKFFEDYLYKYITWRVLTSKRNTPVMVRQEKLKEKAAALRNAKIRMNIKGERLLMTLRGRDKWIK